MIPSIANIRKAIYCLNKRIDLLEGGEYSSTVTELSNKVAALESLLDDDALNPTAAIDKFNEIVAFLDSINNTETLLELLRDVILLSYQQNYVTVSTYANLPTTGSADTIYRVSNYNGSTNQIDTTSYSEYVWDNSDYTLLCVKSLMSEVFDISAYHATGGTLATYADLSAALDSNNGGGVPQSLQKGGMSVKYVRTSDNKYIQARCMAQNFTTDVTQWQGVDDEPTAGSQNIVKSGGVYEKIHGVAKIDLSSLPNTNYINLDNVWAQLTGTTYACLCPVTAGKKYEVITQNYPTTLALLKSNDTTVGSAPDYCDNFVGRIEVASHTRFFITAPTDANYIYLVKRNANGILDYIFGEYDSVTHFSTGEDIIEVGIENQGLPAGSNKLAVSKEVSKLLHINYFEGTSDNSAVSIPIDGLVPGHRYTISLPFTNWNTDAQAGQSVLLVRCLVNGVAHDLLKLTAADMPLSSSYEFVVPNNADSGQISIIGRASSNTKVYFNITDITFAYDKNSEQQDNLDYVNQYLYGNLTAYHGYISTEKKYNTDNTNSRFTVIKVTPEDIISVTASANNASLYFLKTFVSKEIVSGASIDVSSTISTIVTVTAGQTETRTVPADTNYIAINLFTSSDVSPAQVKVNDFLCFSDYKKQVTEKFQLVGETYKYTPTLNQSLVGNFVGGKYNITYDGGSDKSRDYRSIAVTADDNYECMMIEAQAGDIFKFSVKNSYTHAWTILTEEGYLFTTSETYYSSIKEYTIKMPIDGKLLINNRKDYPSRWVDRLIENAQENSEEVIHSDYEWGYINAGELDTVCDITDVVTEFAAGYEWFHTIIDCAEGNLFKITIDARNNAPSYVFLDENNVVITRSYSVVYQQKYTNKIIIAPKNAVKLLVNFMAVHAGNYSLLKINDTSVLDKVYDSLNEYYNTIGRTDPGDFIKVKSLTNVSNTWWIHPRADIYENGVTQLTAFGFVDDNGIVGVAIKDNNAGIYSIKMLKRTSGGAGGDDHNSSAVRFYDGHLLVGHASGHSFSENMYFYIFSDPTNLLDYNRFVIPTPLDEKTTYCNMFLYEGYWYIFYREQTSGWACIKTADFVNYTRISSGCGIYFNFQEIVGRKDVLRVTVYQNGGFTPNKICSCILNLQDMGIYDYSDNYLAPFSDFYTLYSVRPNEGVLPGLVETNNDFPYIRLYDVAYSDVDHLRFTFSRDKGVAEDSGTDETGSYYYYDDGTIIELGKTGFSLHKYSLYYPGAMIDLYNNKNVVFGSEDHHALIKATIQGSSVTDKNIIADSEQKIIRPWPIHGSYRRFFYFDGSYKGEAQSVFTTHATTLKESSMNLDI